MISDLLGQLWRHLVYHLLYITGALAACFLTYRNDLDVDLLHFGVLSCYKTVGKTSQ